MSCQKIRQSLDLSKNNFKPELFRMHQINLTIFIIITTLLVISFFSVLPFFKHQNVQIAFALLFCIYSFQIILIVPNLDFFPSILKFMLLTGRFSTIIITWIFACYLFRVDFKLKLIHLFFLILKISLGFILYFEDPSLTKKPSFIDFVHFTKFCLFFIPNPIFWILIINEVRKGFQSELIQKKKGLVLKTFISMAISWLLYAIVIGIYLYFNNDKFYLSISIGLLSILWYIVLFYISYKGLLELTTTSKNINQLRDSNNELSSQIIEFINSTQIFKEPELTLKKLANKLSLKQEDLRHIILYEMKGFKFNNFRDFINHYRIKEATKLLNENSNSINILNLAYEVGFNSPATFYRAFQKEIGISPKEFMKKYQ